LHQALRLHKGAHPAVALTLQQARQHIFGDFAADDALIYKRDSLSKGARSEGQTIHADLLLLQHTKYMQKQLST
jgi:hypothetical protein